MIGLYYSNETYIISFISTMMNRDVCPQKSAFLFLSFITKQQKNKMVKLTYLCCLLLKLFLFSYSCLRCLVIWRKLTFLAFKTAFSWPFFKVKVTDRLRVITFYFSTKFFFSSFLTDLVRLLTVKSALFGFELKWLRNYLVKKYFWIFRISIGQGY